MFRFCLALATSACFSTLAMAQSSFETKAPHAIILDAGTGEVLFEKDARRPMAPASMTKIMTTQLVFEALAEGSLSPQTEFIVSEEAWRRGGAASGSSTMFLDLDSKVSVTDLLKGVIIQSGNDACIVLAEGMAGSETAFAVKMTARAQELGLSSATFRNSTGWPHAEHVISAYDLAKLANLQINKFPELYALYAEPEFKWNGINQANRNPLLGRFTGADGMKTGHTEASGYGLVGSAKRGDERRIVVINGLNSLSERRDVSTRLMEAAFSQFRVYDLFKADTEIETIDVFMGKVETVGVALSEDIKKGMAIADRKSLSTQVRYKTAIAPIAKGDVIAELFVDIPGRPSETYDLVATSDVKRKGLFGRAWAGLINKLRG